LPGPLPDNHCAEAAALRLALTASELADYSLILYTDSETVIRALLEPTAVKLPPQTRDIVSEVARLCNERGAVVRHHRASTGKLLHDKADKMANWVRMIGGWSNLEEKGVNHE
jgi:ribonuclease HI